MTRQVTASQLRANIYQLVDGVLDTGVPLQINRRGRKLVLIPEEPTGDRLAAIHTDPDAIVGDPDDLVSIDWSGEWDPDRNINP